MFSSLPLHAESLARTEANDNIYKEVQVENTDNKNEDNTQNKDGYYKDNINGEGVYNSNYDYDYNYDSIVETENYYTDIYPIGHELGAVERPNIISRINEVNNIRINGYIPQIVGMNARAAERINARIRDSFTNLVTAGHRDIQASYDVHNWGGITSIVVRYEMAGSRQVVHSFVFDNVSKSEVTLRNLLGRDFMGYINNRITTELKAESVDAESGSITNFRTIRANQSFYIKDGNIHILFEQARVAHERYGVVEFVIPINTLNYTLSHNQFVEKDGKIFVPATVARRFGMDVYVERGGIMHIGRGQNAVRVNVHNDYKNPYEVTYMNGYDVALSADFLKRELGIVVAQVPNSREITVTYTFDR